MEQEKLSVIIDNNDKFIEISDETSGMVLHVDGTTPNPQFLGKAIGKYLLDLQKFKEEKSQEQIQEEGEEK